MTSTPNTTARRVLARRIRTLAIVTLGMMLPGQAVLAASIDAASFCVTEDEFRFDVAVTGGIQPVSGETELILRIAADGTPFSAPVERIAVNFDSANGAITRQAPVVETIESPDFDRWTDGLIPADNYALIDEGDYAWRFTGHVPHGADPFTPGDTLWGVGLRPGNLFLQNLSVTACEPEVVELDIPETTRAPRIDGRLDLGEWRNAVMHDTESGFLSFIHDDDRLYVLVNVLADDHDDAFVQGGGDQVWIYFDIDEDGAITPDVDLRFRLDSGTGNLRFQTFCDDCLFGFNPLEPETVSARGEGFGCFIEDFSLALLPPPSRCNAHRVWELALDLGEIGMRDRSARIGYLIASGEPLLSESFPTDLNDVASYAELTLLGQPRQLRSNGPGAMDVQFEVSQAIQTLQNDVDLVGGRPTALRVWDNGNDAPVYIFVHGRRNGIDLPGSPLLFVNSLFREFSGRPSARDSVATNLTTRLPEEWVTGGMLDFDVLIRGLDGVDVTTLDADISLAQTRTPVFWTVPISHTFPDIPDAFTARDDLITLAEQWLRQIAPIQDIDFVRRPAFEVFNITTSAAMKEKLNEYDQATILAWTIGLLTTGQAPFALPEQTTGFTPFALSGLGGSSDRIGKGGRGRVTWARQSTSSTSMTYPHELNHNLDQKATSTWGLHSRGCNAQSGGALDQAWPYGNSFTIQEVGLWFTNTGVFSSISNTVPDFMSYCAAGTSPRSWWSPYRWQAWVDEFRTSPAVAAQSKGASSRIQRAAMPESVTSGPVESFYVQGRVYPDASGEFTQVLRQPGLPAALPGVTGDHAVRVLGCSGEELAAEAFAVSFLGDEGETEEFVAFQRVLPASGAACSLVLEAGGAVLDILEISAGPPEVQLLAPNGGETWEGVQTVSWLAFDADNGPLTFTLLYSADGGGTWLPVATGLSGTSVEVDTSGWPGSEDARVRVLASNGGHTAQDDSDGAFRVVPKPPVTVILSPDNGTVLDAGRAVELRGVARNTFGQSLPGEQLLWTIGSVPIGTGEFVRINLDEGDYTVVLSAENTEGFIGSDSVDITVANLGEVEDPADVGLPAVDLAGARSYIVDDRLVCELTVRSGPDGLAERSRFACHFDFDDFESESTSGCDADGDGFLESTYRLGTNGGCSTIDASLTYRHGRRGGECTGGPEVNCLTTEHGADGNTDAECDGVVDGQPAISCTVMVAGLRTTLSGEREAQCGDAEGECFGGPNEPGESERSFVFYEAQLRKDKDWLPDTDDGQLPNDRDEALLIPLQP